MTKPMLEKKCKECLEPIVLEYDEGTNQQLQERGVCFICNIWLGYIQRKDNADVVRVSGRHYVIGLENTIGMRGFSAQRVVIRFYSGLEVVTTNLWSQGVVPLRFRDRLPNNASFIES